jgi:hypothetical protein
MEYEYLAIHYPDCFKPFEEQTSLAFGSLQGGYKNVYIVNQVNSECPITGRPITGKC